MTARVADATSEAHAWVVRLRTVICRARCFTCYVVPTTRKLVFRKGDGARPKVLPADALWVGNYTHPVVAADFVADVRSTLDLAA